MKESFTEVEVKLLRDRGDVAMVIRQANLEDFFAFASDPE